MYIFLKMATVVSHVIKVFVKTLKINVYIANISKLTTFSLTVYEN